eukprot:COSAG01_NODE_4032_length_5416_cov_11.025954_4_plen_133_part_00
MYDGHSIKVCRYTSSQETVLRNWHPWAQRCFPAIWGQRIGYCNVSALLVGGWLAGWRVPSVSLMSSQQKASGKNDFFCFGSEPISWILCLFGEPVFVVRIFPARRGIARPINPSRALCHLLWVFTGTHWHVH